MHFMTSSVTWSDVLSGNALARFVGRFIPKMPDVWKRSGPARPDAPPPEPMMSGPGAKAFSGQS